MNTSPVRSRRVLLALGLLSLALAGFGMATAFRISMAPEATVAEAPEAAAEEAAVAAATPEVAPEEVAAVAAPEAAEEAEIAEAAAEELAAPTFDIVRVEPDGAALVAGQAEPGARVTVYADAEALAEVEADRDGNFVALFGAGTSDAPRALTLDVEAEDGRTATSADFVLLLPPAPGAGATATAGAEVDPYTAGFVPAASVPDGAAPVADVAAEDPAAEAGEQIAALTPEETTPGEVAAAVIVRDGVVEVASTRASPSIARRVTLASISYDETGEVSLAGTGTAGAGLRAYVDDAFASDGHVDEEGRWVLDLEGVAAGIYRLRIDQIGGDGVVASRVETPFQRDFPRPAVEGPDGVRPVSVTVQPGNNLWTLARTHYGQGVHYTQIFTANAEQIRDPALIYPGQIFTLPDIDRTQ